MRKKLQLNKGLSLITSLLLLFPLIGFSQVQIAHLDCYPQFTTAAEMDAAAALDGTSPFATWRGAYEYAVANNESTVDFASGYYLASALGGAFQWGGSASEFSVGAGSIVTNVNGNGAVLSMEGLGTCTDAFAYITGTGAVIDGMTLVEYCGDDAGAIGVNGVSGWTISNCNFDACDRNGHSAVEVTGGAIGTITGCNFYNHSFTTASAMDISGASTDVSILNSTFTCNYRDNNGDSGGAVLITGGTSTFTDCTFNGNIAGGNAPGGAVSIRNGAADVTFNSTLFTCNEANTLTDQNGGAIHVEGNGVSLNINGCTFTGNIAKLQGGAINSAGAVTTPVALTVMNSTFDNNSTNTSISKGGAIYLNNTDAFLSGNYLHSNSVSNNGFGGAVYVSNNQSGNNATYTFISNTMQMNMAGNGGDCSGNDVFSQQHISGSDNKLDFLADGHQLSEHAGSLQFDNGDDCDNSSNWSSSMGSFSSNSDYLTLIGGSTSNVYGSQVETMNGGVYYWTINFYSPSSFSSGKYMGFVLAADNVNLFNATSGFAIRQRRISSTNKPIEFISIGAGGIDDIGGSNILYTFANPSAVGSSSFKIKYDNGTWTFWFGNAPTSDALFDDTRGFNYCTPDATIGASLPSGLYHVGPYFYSTSSSSSQIAQFNNYYFRSGDETTGNGGSGSGVVASCGACFTTTNPIVDCSDQGSIQGYVFDDTTSPDGMSDGNTGLAGVIVSLTGSDGSVVMVTTDASGLYYFGGLSNGVTYTVSFDSSNLPSTYYPTYQNQPGATNTNDSDADPNGAIPPITICVNCSSNLDNTDGTSGSSNYVSVDAGFSTNPILPVTFGTIEVKSKNCTNVIEWTTLSEVNNNHFNIERSVNGRTFTTIATIQGNGTTAQLSTYVYKDGTTNNAKLVYYRIAQVDYDGQVGYSDVKTVLIDNCNDENLKFNIYPTAFSDVIQYELSLDYSAATTLTIYNSQGMQVARRKIENTNVKAVYQNWDLSHLTPGLYLVKSSNQDRVIKIIKH